MYNGVWKILIHSNIDQIYKVIKNMEPIENIIFDVSWSTSFDNTDVRTSDVIVLDAPFTPVVAEHISVIKNPKAKLIICVDHDSDQAMLEKLSNHINYICIKPLTEKSIKYYFKKLQRKIQLEEEYENIKRCLQSFIEAFDDIVWFKDDKGTILNGNNALFPYTTSDKEILTNKKGLVSDETLDSCGKIQHYKTYKNPIFNYNHDVIGTIGIAQDITDEANTVAGMHSIIESLPLPLMITDINEYILKCNHAILNLFELSKEDVLNKQIDSVTSEYTSKFEKITIIDEEEENNSIHVISNKGDKAITYRVIKEPIYNVFNELTGYIYYMIDVTMEHEYQKMLFNAANKDYLTGVNNRRTLEQYFLKHREKEDCTLLLFDIDNFKAINDLYGHNEGDDFLITFSKLLKTIFTEEHVFRMCGDEFLGLIPEQFSDEEIFKLCDTFIETFSNALKSKYPEAALDVNIGILRDTDKTISSNSLLSMIDEALVHAKTTDKIKYYLHP